MAVTVLLQGVGSLAMFACVTLVAKIAGPAAQGIFSTVKSAVDFLAALALLGMPQAFLYFLQTNKKPLATCLSVAAVHSLVAGIWIWLWYSLLPDGFWSVGSSGPFVMGLITAFCVTYGDLRGIALATHSSATFGRISTLPNILVLVVVIGYLFVENNGVSLTTQACLSVFLVAYLGSAILVVAIIAPKNHRLSLKGIGREIADMLPFGMSSWMPAVFQSAVTFFALGWVGRTVSDADAVGAFAAALTLVVTAITPLSLAVPLLYKWWISLEEKTRIREVGVSIAVAVAAATALWVVVMIFEKPLVEFIFGEAYLKYSGLYSMVFTAVVPQAVLRLFTVYCNSAGRPRMPAFIECGRAIIIVGGLLLYGYELSSIAVAWLVGEMLSLLACLLVLGVETSSRKAMP